MTGTLFERCSGLAQSEGIAGFEVRKAVLVLVESPIDRRVSDP